MFNKKVSKSGFEREIWMTKIQLKLAIVSHATELLARNSSVELSGMAELALREANLMIDEITFKDK